MKCRPAIRVNVVDVSVAIIDDRPQCLWLLLFIGEHGLVDWGFTENGFTIINLAPTINKVLNIAIVCLVGSLIQILQHVACKFILAHVEWSLSKGSRGRLSSFLLQEGAHLENAEVTSDVQGRLVIFILLI